MKARVSADALPPAAGAASPAADGPVLRLLADRTAHQQPPPGSPECAAFMWRVDGAGAARELAAAAPSAGGEALAAAAAAELAAFARCLARGQLAVEVFDADSGLQVCACVRGGLHFLVKFGFSFWAAPDTPILPYRLAPPWWTWRRCCTPAARARRRTR